MSTGFYKSQNGRRSLKMFGKKVYFGIVFTLLSLVAILAFSGQTSARGKVEVVTTFDAANGELPEGIAIDKPGNIYATLGPPFFVGGGYGAVLKISPDGNETTVLVEYPEGPAPAGLVVDAPGNVYFAVPDPGGTDVGVYLVNSDGGAERLPGTENMLVPNGLAFDKQGNLFVSDSALGAIWRIPVSKSTPAEIWLQHELVAGCTADDLGANGIAFWKGDLFVANTSRGALVKVPVATDGSPGEPMMVAGNTDCEPTGLFGMDGIALDVHGNVYALLVLQNKFVKINPADGSYTVLLTEEDGLWNASSLAFGTGKGDRESLFISNYAVLPPEPENSLGPAVLKVEVGVSGLPLP
jgi:sugar lactone lactonase YvrE